MKVMLKLDLDFMARSLYSLSIELITEKIPAALATPLRSA